MSDDILESKEDPQRMVYLETAGVRVSLNEVELIRNGDRIEAVRSMRSRATYSLVEAKAILDAVEDWLGLAQYEPCPYCKGMGKRRVF